MKKFGLFLIVLLQSAAMSAQEVAFSPAPVADDGVAQAKRMGTVDAELMRAAKQDKNILNHLDVGVNVGTTGIGINVAAPIGDYVRVRLGYDYMPRFQFKSDFTVETTSGNMQKIIDKWNNIDVDKKVQEMREKGYDIDNYPDYKALLEKFRNVKLHDQVTMGIKPNVHQFKFLVDVMPFKRNKHWSITAGIYVGSSKMGDACNLDKEKEILEGVVAYNELYIGFCNGTYTDEIAGVTDRLINTGIAGFRIGNFEDGDIALMVPGEDATARAEMHVNKVRPYIGLGYNTHLSKNKRWKLSVDAGVLFLGKPSIYVDNIYKIDKQWGSSYWSDKGGKTAYEAWKSEQFDNFNHDVVRWNFAKKGFDGPEELGIIHNHVDMVSDLHDIKGKVGDMVNLLSKFKVYPNASVTFSYRLF